ncbi:cysteine-rich receptor-like protein kinase 25 isoform X3 [Vitis riparia]|nr:cysteine-rich receptor-like protein kinase 25 isoform X3 [Vitis riparia]
MEELEPLVPSDSKDIDNVKQFSLVSVMAATNNFSDENKLGKGGFGPVYKGILPGGQEIAVKRLSRDSKQGSAQFYNERLIAKQQHRNLVRLLGYCIEGEEKMLIYEFMPNRSLEDVLFAPAGRKMLDWNKRCKIIEGIVQGLDYLHRHSRLNMVHRDLKASNILLDDDMNPKISNFGTARIFEPNASEAYTSELIGTRGYMPPEYVMEGAYSQKTDVYSFGVLLLEIVSGQRNISNDRAMDLVNYARQLWREGKGLELVDPAVRDPHSTTQMLRCIHVALLCLQTSDERPEISDVCSMLNSQTGDLPNPNPRPFGLGTTGDREGKKGQARDVEVSGGKTADKEVPPRRGSGETGPASGITGDRGGKKVKPLEVGASGTTGDLPNPNPRPFGT